MSVIYVNLNIVLNFFVHSDAHIKLFCKLNLFGKAGKERKISSTGKIEMFFFNFGVI